MKRPGACFRARGRRGNAALVVLAGVALLPAAARSADWKLSASGNVGVTVTDNANLAPKGQAKSDLILQATPVISASREGARLKVNATFAPTGIVYVEGTSANKLYSAFNGFASLQAVENFFWIDARANVSQQFISPFGAQPFDLAASTSNRTTVQSYGVSPYIRGRFANGMSYLARNDSYWTIPSGNDVATSYSNYSVARLDSAPALISWGLEADSRTTNYSGQSDNNLTNTNYRARLTWTPDPQFQLFATGGYQTNNYSATQRSGAIYGGGFNWQPTERTSLTARYEEQFYGPSYLAAFNHRTPLSTWSVSGSRTLSSYPQQVVESPLGDTAVLLNSLLLSRFPDPAQRQAEVQRLIQTLGLPPFLTTPLSFYTQQVFVNERIQATAGLLGVRNTVTFTVFTGYNETVPATSDITIQDQFATVTRINQSGASMNWNHRLTPLTSVNGFASILQSRTPAPSNAESTTDYFRLGLSHQLGPKTTGSAYLRYTIFDSNTSNDYRETALFATLFHTF